MIATANGALVGTAGPKGDTGDVGPVGGGLAAVSVTAPVAGNGTPGTPVNVPAAVASGASGLLTGADKAKLDGIAAAAIAAVTADGALSGAGTAASHLVIAAASALVPGTMSAADFAKLSKINWVSANAQTTTSGTVDLATINCAAIGTYYFLVCVYGTNAAGTSGYAVLGLGTWQSTGIAMVTISGLGWNPIVTQNSFGSGSVALVTSGTNVIVRATGLVAGSATWGVAGFYGFVAG